MKYLLDTCVISDFVKGEPKTLARIKHTSPIEIAVSTITLMEIQYGLALNTKYAKTIKTVIHDFLSAVSILNFNQEDAEKTALIRATLKQQSNPIGSYDILLAGTALNRQLILVSANEKEFKRVKGLVWENWRVL